MKQYIDIARRVFRDLVMHILVRNNLENLSQDFKLYLYGHSSLSSIENKTILLATIKFLKDSERFFSYLDVHAPTHPSPPPRPTSPTPF